MLCPFCQEEIQDTALKCKHCGEWLSEARPSGIGAVDDRTSIAREHPPLPASTVRGLTLNRVIALTVSLLAIGLAVYWMNDSMTKPSGGVGAVTTDYSPRTVTYHVVGEGTDSASLTYENSEGGSQQETVRLPWQKTFSVQEGDFLYISAQNQDDRGTIAVQIRVDGRDFKTSQSSGAYTIATASGSCP